ncbi:MAG: hypothetical protein M1291_01340 [Thaumarchaeota archaeon]|nr:hypothetical protein [Nitrososphaerota archaeon]
MNSPKPRVAIAISLAGLVFQLSALLLEIAVFALAAFAPSGRAVTLGPFIFFWSVPFIMLGLIFIALGLAGIAFLNTGKRARVTAGGMLLIISSIFAFPTLFGFFIGSALMFVGGILAIIWAPAKGI